MSYSFQTTVEFLRLPGSLSSVEYPLLSTANVDLSSYTLFTRYNVRVTGDLEQDIKVMPTTDYDKPNCVRMLESIYWITGYKQATSSELVMTYHVVYNAPSSLIHKGDSITGYFERTGPTRYCKWLKYQPYSGDGYDASWFTIPNINSQMNTAAGQYYWVQFTSTQYITPNEKSTAYTKTSIKNNLENDRLSTYGFFAGCYDSLIARNDSETIYPPIKLLMNYIEYLGISASTVTDVSISDKCPYAFTGTASTYIIKLNNSLPMIYIGADGSDYSYVAYYNITDYMNLAYVASKTVTPNFGTSGLINFGNINIKDCNGSVVGTVPYKYANKNLTVQTFPDLTGIYTRLKTADNNYQWIIKEGKLPWVGSSWEEYRAFSMAFDEQSVRNTNDMLEVQGIANALNSTVQGVLAGAMIGGGVGALAGTIGGLASAGANVASNIAQINYNKNEQANLEKRMQAQAGTAYSPTEGYSYIFQTMNYPARVALELPYGYDFDSNWASEYINQYGYPDDLVKRSITINGGYYKGKLTYDSSRTGVKFDLLNNALINGFRYLEV